MTSPSSLFAAAAMDLKPWIVGLRRYLHQNPELGHEEYKTAAAIEDWLRELGIESQRQGTAVIGLIRGAKPGKTVALRADIDALPIHEEGHGDYRSRKDGLMHACGHDAHTAIQLGAARLLADLRGDLAGNVKLLFQPAEETDGGAETMIREGCLENPHVDRIYGLHVMPDVPVGFVQLKRGVMLGSSTSLKLRIHGKSAHGAYPETGIDAVLIAAHVVAALHVLVGRYVSPLHEAVLTIGTIHGGRASNILANRVDMEATLRTTDPQVRDTLVERIRAVVEGFPPTLGGGGELAAAYGCEALVNHDEAVDEIVEAAREVLGTDRISWSEKPSMGVDDFALFIKVRPGAYYNLGCGNVERGITSPLHSATFDLDEDCLVHGAAMQAGLAWRFLRKA
jgi:amidohydrolase